jgi:hypothetical protein
MLAAAELNKDMATHQQRTWCNLRHAYATMELMSSTEIHTLARHHLKLMATMAQQQLAWSGGSLEFRFTHHFLV